MLFTEKEQGGVSRASWSLSVARGFLELSRSKMEGAQNRQLQYKKPTFSGLKGQQKRSGVAGASAGPCFSMLKQNIAGESQAGRGSQKNSGGCYKGRRKVPAGWGVSGRFGFWTGRDQWGHKKPENKKPEMQQFWGHFQGGFSRFFRIFSVFIAFQCFSGCFRVCNPRF